MPGEAHQHERREPPRLARERATVDHFLDEQVARGDALAAEALEFRDESAFATWRADKRRWVKFTEEGLLRSYTTDFAREEFLAEADPPSFIGPPDDWRRWLLYERKEVLSGVNVLRSLSERLALHSDGPAAPTRRADAAPSNRDTVFLVHGRNDGLRQRSRASWSR